MFRVSSSYLVLAVALLAAGCGHYAWFSQHGPAPMVVSPAIPMLENPLPVAIADSEFVWNQVVDTVDDYFKIEREERVRAIGGALTAGRIDTYPLVGATLLEPWRRDSTPGFEKLHSTLQSVRRQATVHVIPVEKGFSVEVIVLKELEDVIRPENASVGATASRHDESPTRNQATLGQGPGVLGWIGLGRDTSLEQEILAQLQGRVADFRPMGAF